MGYDANGTTITATPVGEPFSGEPFNCELWDAVIYDEENFRTENEKGISIALTDRDGSGKVDDDERFGCPVNMKVISTNNFQESIE